jgi:hypothetical protein
MLVGSSGGWGWSALTACVGVLCSCAAARVLLVAIGGKPLPLHRRAGVVLCFLAILLPIAIQVHLALAAVVATRAGLASVVGTRPLDTADVSVGSFFFDRMFLNAGVVLVIVLFLCAVTPVVVATALGVRRPYSKWPLSPRSMWFHAIACLACVVSIALTPAWFSGILIDV